MARPYRLQAEDCFYHITSRGNNRKNIFLNDIDRRKFLEYVGIAKGKFACYVYAYCLMGNHYHLLLETTQPNLSKIMQYINTSYTVYFNHKRRQNGHLFQGRFKSILIEQDIYFKELTRYIHLNPVRAKIIENPLDYAWSSYKTYISAKKDPLIDIDRVKMFLNMKLSRYRSFVEGTDSDFNLSSNVHAGFILGNKAFIKDKLNLLKQDIESRDFAHKRQVINTIDPQDIIKVIADHFKLSSEQLCYLKKRPIMTAKRAAIYALKRKTGLTNTQIGNLFNMKHAAVSMASQGFENKMKEDKGLKKMVDKLFLKFEV